MRAPWALLISLLLLQSTTISYSPTSYYVHIPFCRQKCSYCDFTTVPVSTASFAPDRLAGPYTASVIDEIKAQGANLSKPAPLKTIYFGGGTPSLLPPASISSILETIRSLHGIQEDAEVTMELDPGTFDSSMLKELTRCGVNRVSLGVQSFDDDVLRISGRTHTVRDAEEAILMVKGCRGLRTWTLDLIGGLPGCNASTWVRTLHKALSSNPPHLSCYDLTLEKNTDFGRRYVNGRRDNRGVLPDLPGGKLAADMYRIASETLNKAGYEHYEVSSYARENKERSGRSSERSVHNQNYWKWGGEWWGVGVGATSRVNGLTVARPKTLEKYYKFVERLKQKQGGREMEDDDDVDDDNDVDDAGDTLVNYVTTALRTKEGVEVEVLRENGVCKGVLDRIKSACDFFVERNMCEVTEERIRLTDPEGFLFSNTIISEIIMHLG
jgi:oxygen-independent coproporphyrinogen-3 oxidase